MQPTDPILPECQSIEHGAMRYDGSRIPCADAALFDPSSPGIQAVPVGHGGRQAAWFIEGCFGSGVLRHYRRGGLVAKLSPDRYVWLGSRRTRSMAEFDLLRSMFEAGLPVPRPLAAAWWRRGLFYRAAIIVERIPDARTLAQHVLAARSSIAGTMPQGNEGSAGEGRLHEAIARAIFTMHDAGFWHADLNAYNILLGPGGDVCLIDFDKGRQGVFALRERRANLLRLRRSLVKIAHGEGDMWWKGVNDAYKRLEESKNDSVE